MKLTQDSSWKQREYNNNTQQTKYSRREEFSDHFSVRYLRRHKSKSSCFGSKRFSGEGYSKLQWRNKEILYREDEL